jgi:hypothetical protein
MNMNRFTSLPAILLLALFVLSCATTSPRQKMLIGKWKPVKIENANIPEHKTAVVQQVVPDTLAQNPAEGKTDTTRVALSREEEKLNHLVQSEMRGTFQFNADKTAVKFIRGKAVNATWKLKKHGTILTAKNPETGNKLELEILRMNDSTATVIEKFQDKKLRVTLQKEK